jgi:hypothetical protein
MRPFWTKLTPGNGPMSNIASTSQLPPAAQDHLDLQCKVCSKSWPVVTFLPVAGKAKGRVSSRCLLYVNCCDGMTHAPLADHGNGLTPWPMAALSG